MTVAGELSALGPFFTIRTHESGAGPGHGWQPIAELVQEPGCLERRVHGVRMALAASGSVDDVDLRVAASVAHLGLAARLQAPVLGATVLGLAPIGGRLEDLWWQDRLGGPFPLSVRWRPGAQAPDGTPAVEAVTVAFASRFGVSARVLWGNVGSAANSAAQLVAQARPDRAEAAGRAADAILADPRIDSGSLRSGPGFRRRSCCLIYRLADASPRAICGDCVLR